MVSPRALKWIVLGADIANREFANREFD